MAKVLKALPNGLSLFRIGLAPLLMLCIMNRAWALALSILTLGALTDVGDGWIARHYGGESRLGKILDPLADKIFLGALFLALAAIGKVPRWLVFFVLGREALVVAGGFILWTLRKQVLRPHWISKVNTALQCVIGGGYLLAWPVSLPLGIMIATSFVSTLIYAYQGWNLLRRRMD